MTSAEYEKEFIKGFQSLCRVRSSWEVWQCLISTWACAISNAFDKSENHYQAREEEYAMSIRKLGDSNEVPAQLLAMKAYPGRIKTINQEGILYEDFKRQPSRETRYRTEWMSWAKSHGAYPRGIEYVKSAAGIAKCKAYYLAHGWPGLYISRHKNLCGD